jgi:hypothetical protein
VDPSVVFMAMKEANAGMRIKDLGVDYILILSGDKNEVSLLNDNYGDHCWFGSLSLYW